MSESEAYFYQDFAKHFGTYHVRDEDPHPEYLRKTQHFALTETQYFGFSIPEESIHAFLYLWYHPHLKTVAAGPMVMRGVKESSLAAEIIDYQNYLPDSQLSGGLTNFCLSNSYSVEMLTPGREFRVRYSDAARDNSIDAHYTAVSDVLMWPSGRHFEQVMRVEGEVRIRGRSYRIGGHNVRDRSWGEARLENPLAGPPIGWMTGVFDDGLAFNVTAFDHPDLGPMWKDRLPLTSANTFKFGWIVVDGEPRPLRDARTLTTYDSKTLLPATSEMHIVDIKGRGYHLVGRVVAGAPIHPFLNNRAPICLIRWECEGRVGWGDIQQAQGHDFVSLFHGR